MKRLHLYASLSYTGQEVEQEVVPHQAAVEMGASSASLPADGSEIWAPILSDSLDWSLYSTTVLPPSQVTSFCSPLSILASWRNVVIFCSSLVVKCTLWWSLLCFLKKDSDSDLLWWFFFLSLVVSLVSMFQKCFLLLLLFSPWKHTCIYAAWQYERLVLRTPIFPFIAVIISREEISSFLRETVKVKALVITVAELEPKLREGNITIMLGILISSHQVFTLVVYN